MKTACPVHEVIVYVQLNHLHWLLLSVLSFHKMFVLSVLRCASNVQVNTLESCDDFKSKRHIGILYVYIHRKQVRTVLYILPQPPLLCPSTDVISLHQCVYECISAMCVYGFEFV